MCAVLGDGCGGELRDCIWVAVKNYGPFVGGTLNNRCRNILGTQKKTRDLTTTHMPRKASIPPTSPQRPQYPRRAGPQVRILRWQSNHNKTLGFRLWGLGFGV